MANVQGRRHKRRKRRQTKKTILSSDNEMYFIDTDDYIWENHVVGRLPFKDPDDVEIVFHSDKLWQDDNERFSKFSF